MKPLDTPIVLLNLDKLERNVADMAAFDKEAGVRFRPHIKIHKTPEIAVRQMALGAVGITVSKLGEAEVMVKAGIKDIFIAYQLVGESKMLRLQKLLQQARVSVAVDSLVGASLLAEVGRGLRWPGAGWIDLKKSKATGVRVPAAFDFFFKGNLSIRNQIAILQELRILKGIL